MPLHVAVLRETKRMEFKMPNNVTMENSPKQPESQGKISPANQALNDSVSGFGDRVQRNAEQLISHSQKALLEAGMDLNKDGKVAFNEFRAALQVNGKNDLNAVLARPF